VSLCSAILPFFPDTVKGYQALTTMPGTDTTKDENDLLDLFSYKRNDFLLGS